MFKPPTQILEINTLLDHMISTPRPRSEPRQINSDLYPCVHPDDVEPVDLIQPDIDFGPWIAGGAALQWYQKQPVGLGDIDVFCRNEQQATELLDRLSRESDCIVRYRTENAVTIEMRCTNPKQPDWRIQVIRARYYESVESVIDNFDITVCQIGTAGREWILGDSTALDLKHRVLRMIPPLREGAVKRLLKYWTYGYEPVEGLVEAISQSPNTKWEFDPAEDYK